MNPLKLCAIAIGLLFAANDLSAQIILTYTPPPIIIGRVVHGPGCVIFGDNGTVTIICENTNTSYCATIYSAESVQEEIGPNIGSHNTIIGYHDPDVNEATPSTYYVVSSIDEVIDEEGVSTITCEPPIED